MAQVELDPSGTKTRQFDSDFTGSLPVAVKVSFKLDGKPVSARDVKHRAAPWRSPTSDEISAAPAVSPPA